MSGNGRTNNGNAAGQKSAAERAEAEKANKAEADRIAAEQAEADRIAAEKAEADRIAAEQAEADRIAAEQAEADRIAAEKAYKNNIAGGSGAGGGDRAAQEGLSTTAGVFPQRGPVRVVVKSDTKAVVTDDVETWKVDLADGEPTKSIAPSLLLRSEQEANGSATVAPKASNPTVVAETAESRVLDDGVNRWKEAVA